jgi:F-type H+-transporting ATPase subunit delta
MDEPLTKDARGIVDGVVTYLKGDSRASSMAPKVERFLGKVTAQARKEKIARVETSVALTEQEQTSIETMLKMLIGHPVTITSVISPEVIGGLRIQVADWIVDTTLQTQLAEIADSLTK